jgi:sulfur carrier protein ThiS
MQLNLRIKLYGTLSRAIDDYDHSSGLNASLPDGSSVQDLLDHLEIQPKRVGMVQMNDRAVQKDKLLEDGALIKILQPIVGG